MRLKSIKLAGFKSFVDPTTVLFPHDLCAIVGPNGCGKSNIIDAVRWVMGESSAKHLRGESMTDVIFSGSGGRKPVGQASIELIFDNSDGTIVGEYAGYNEISVKRLVTRDNQSTYFLNGQKCRRRDITDIFLGTGLGPRSYAIIEQGMISRLVEAKPEELRVFLEEAAGISKYKDRRRDTENRIRRTKENLERLTDIRDELERQLNTLKRQSQAAEKYKEYKQEERLKKAQLQGLKWQKLQADFSVKDQIISEGDVKIEALKADQTALDTDIEKLRQQHTELTDRFNEVQGRYYEEGAEIARVEQDIQHRQERTRQLKEDLTQVEVSFTETHEHIKEDQVRLENWKAELAEMGPQLEEVAADEAKATEGSSAIDHEMHQWQEQWDSFNEGASENSRRAEVQQSRIQHLEQALQRLTQRIQKLDEERQGLALPSDADIDANLTEEVARLSGEQDQKQDSLQKLEQGLNQKRESIRNWREQLDSEREILQPLLGRYASLEALQQAAVGHDEAVDAWLNQQGLSNNKRLADELQVESGWEHAVETVLGDYLQAVCTDNFESVASHIGGLQQGSLTVVDTQQVISESGAINAAKLVDKLTSRYSLSGVLSGVYAVNSVADGLQLRQQLKPNESVVTRDGVWLGGNWIRVSGANNEQGGILERKQEMESLQQQITAKESSVDQLQRQLSEARDNLQQQEAQRTELLADVQTIANQYSEARAKLSAQSARAEEAQTRHQQIIHDLTEGREHLAAEQSQVSEARTLLEQAIEAMESDNAHRDDLNQQKEALQSKRDAARLGAQQAKDKLHQLRMRQQSVTAQVESVQQGLERLQQQSERLQERQVGVTAAITDTENPIEEMQQQLELFLGKRLEIEEELTVARREMEVVANQLREVEQKRNVAEQKTQQARSELESVRLEAKTLQVQSENLVEQIKEGQYTLEAILEQLPEDIDQTVCEQELEKITNRIQRLGAINLAAIDEFHIQSERKQYLDAQNDELMDALETLQSAIRKIDKETRSRFKETFEKVNSSLQELFPKFFGGGSAYLEMTGEDLLDTGVAIMARPPGKRNSTIHLLSGGEKALTAISLVFSIFRLNPSPFCILDEVDAPLDDANVERYANMIREMSSTVQFIYITHNKISMEVADQLMGVTMHEAGVSRLVSVDVEEAAELASA